MDWIHPLLYILYDKIKKKTVKVNYNEQHL